MIRLYKVIGEGDSKRVHSAEFPDRNLPMLLKKGWKKTAPKMNKEESK